MGQWEMPFTSFHRITPLIEFRLTLVEKHSRNLLKMDLSVNKNSLCLTLREKQSGHFE